MNRFCVSYGLLCVLTCAGVLLGSAGCEPETACDATSCPTGCCSLDQCVEAPTNAQCGIQGSQCVACASGSSCQTGRCLPTGGLLGCKDATGMNQPGTSTDACGIAGQLCTKCQAGQACVAGRCVSNCSRTTCPDGCCGPNGCVRPQPSDTACGLLGAKCQACTTGKKCIAGECVADTGCANCAGCCKDGKYCVTGNSPDACGKGGGACMDCPSGSTCSNGSCGQAGNCPPECTGCCDGNGKCVALTKQDTDTCGRNGGECKACTEQNAKCISGQCVTDQPCFAICKDGCCTGNGQCLLTGTSQQNQQNCGVAGSGQCVPCKSTEFCNDGTCEENVSWTITADSATIADGDDTWDPYLELRIAGQSSVTTASIQNTSTPNWDEELGTWSEKIILENPTTIWLTDSVSYWPDNDISECVIQILEADLAAGFKSFLCEQNGLIGSDSTIRLTFVMKTSGS